MSSRSPHAHPDLVSHLNGMTPEMMSFGRVHMFFGGSPVNVTLVEAGDHAVLFDAGIDEPSAREARRQFAAVSDLPITTVVYSHFHGDHVCGVRGFVDDEAVHRGEVQIVAHDTFLENLVRDCGVVGPIMGRRASFQMGFRLDPGLDGTLGTGLGPGAGALGSRGFLPPTRTFRDHLVLDAVSPPMELLHVPSETDDQVVGWLPEERILLSADVLPGENFPNLYPLRGSRHRDPAVWFRGIDRLRRLEAEVLLPHHGRAVVGRDNVDEVLTAYRDGIQYVHDQTVRHMNRGLAPDELAEVVQLPDHLREHPWLGENYGAVSQSVRSVYAGYLGWFAGDPCDLDPIPRRERASRYVEALGGRAAILKQSRMALREGDAKWAADLASWLIRADVGDEEARSVKAEALTCLGYAQRAATWRNWFLTSAAELREELHWQGVPLVGGAEQVAHYPLATLIELLGVRLRAEAAVSMHVRVALDLADTGESCGFEVRRGVSEFLPTKPNEPDLCLTTTREVLDAWATGQSTLQDSVRRGIMQTDDDQLAIQVLDLFDPVLSTEVIRVATR